MSRLPVRVRLTLAFTGGTAVVLAALGAFLFVQVRQSLDEQLAAGLRAQADAVATGGRVTQEETVTQVLGADGRVVSGHAIPLVETGGGARFVDRDVAGLEDGPYRLYVRPHGRGTIVVGTSLEERNEALGSLLAAFLVGGPVALALLGLGGYALAGALLSPVERMRRQATAISAATAGERLPLPRADDEISRLGTTLNAMLDRLEAGLERERRFVADASHELRTPLALLRTELELARRGQRTAEELRAALDSAADEVERLTRLAEDLLVLARLDEGELPLRKETIVVAELLESVARRFDREITVVADGGSVVGDRLRLEQALGNLVDNALRHGEGDVRLTAARRDGILALTVSDEGRGFPRDFLPVAFERFTRGDAAREGGGAGLGLAIVDAVARAHGGQAHAEGAAVTVELPA